MYSSNLSKICIYLSVECNSKHYTDKKTTNANNIYIKSYNVCNNLNLIQMKKVVSMTLNYPCYDTWSI